MAGSQTAFGSWLTNTFTPAGTLSKAMSGPAAGVKSPPSAASDLGLTSDLTPEEIAARKKKLMSAGGPGALHDFGSAASSLGLRTSP